MDAGAARGNWEWLMRQRVAETIVDRTLDPTNTIALGVSAVSVFSIAFAEGWLRTCPHPLRWRFCTAYARAQLLPSIIWLTADPHDIADSWSVKSKSTEGLVRTATTATLRRRLFFLQCLRSVIFGFVGIAQILRVVDIASSSKTEYQHKVMSGKEPLMSGIQGRVVRLAGKTSDVTECSLARHGFHIVPVYENKAEDVFADYTHNGNYPVGWVVNEGLYGIQRCWEGFKPTEEWLFPVNPPANATPSQQKPRRLLIMEADCSVGEESLALGSERFHDLTLSETAQGFAMIKLLASSFLQKNAETETDALRVILMDTDAHITSGGGNSVSNRAFVEQRKDADVSLDARRPLINAIQHWVDSCEKKTGTPSQQACPPEVVFDTDNTEYFTTVKDWLSSSGCKVLDRHDASVTPDHPRLVYCNTTHETVTAASSILHAGLANPDKVGLLLDNARGVRDMKHHPELLSASYICSAAIYSDMFEEVRRLACEGRSWPEIQTLMDNKNTRVHLEL
ncbi:hypothetical protein DIPPA_34297 [Diplonema papillatum]|nr:hypothetical protein DIPPA_34297 [Diplonema papillatum]